MTTIPPSSTRTADIRRPRGAALIAAVALALTTLAACGEATTGDDPTARVPTALYSAPGGAQDDRADRWKSDAGDR
ncbi:MAG: hypothetical protein AB7P21_09825 [Lautropia sp.]